MEKIINSIIEAGLTAEVRKVAVMGGIRISGRREDSPYGISIIRTPFSYGGKDGLWELAVLKDGKFYEKDNPITFGDVRGYLTSWEAADLVKEFAAWEEMMLVIKHRILLGKTLPLAASDLGLSMSRVARLETEARRMIASGDWPFWG